MPSTLAYWDIRGLGQFIRLLLKYVGENFEDKRYPCQTPGEEAGASWYKEKYSHGLDFSNLPYYMDGTVKLTQSLAIMKYLGRKYKLVAGTEEERIREDMLGGECTDFLIAFVHLCYDPKFEELKGDFLKNVKVKLGEFETFLGDRPWFVGSKLTWIDFYIYEALDHHLCCWTDLLGAFPKLALFMKRFEALPQIRDYLSSPACIKRPLYKPTAFFGCKL